MTLRTTTLYEPAAEPVHPDGGPPGGAIEAVTACLAKSLTRGLAVAAAAKASTRWMCSMLVGINDEAQGTDVEMSKRQEYPERVQEDSKTQKPNTKKNSC